MLANKQYYISIGILLVATVGLYLGVVLPSTYKVRELHVSINAEHAKIEGRYQRRGQLRDTLKILQEVRSGVADLTSIAIHDGKELEFIRALEEAAADRNIEQDIQLKTVNQIELSEWEREVPVTLLVKGRYVDVLNYIRDIETLPYYITIDSFTFQTSRSDKAKSFTEEPVQATLNGSVYWITSDVPSIITVENI